jgi:hypothetical protein
MSDKDASKGNKGFDFSQQLTTEQQQLVGGSQAAKWKSERPEDLSTLICHQIALSRTCTMPGNYIDNSEIGDASLPLDEDLEESKALEILIREETKLQLEAAWVAQRRLARACFVNRPLKESAANDQQKSK